MDGVILFVDDHIYSEDRPEAALYKKLRKEHPTLGVHSLGLAKEAVQAIGTFSAIILDWQYDSASDISTDAAKELNLPKVVTAPSQKEDAALEFLQSNDFYSLIFIFSEIDIEEKHGSILKEKFGNRVKFKTKSEFKNETVEEYQKDILAEIELWKTENKNLAAPILWSVAINQSIQKIFKELADAEANWLKELYNSASEDGVDPELFIIELLQLILSEEVILDSPLRKAIKEIGEVESSEVPKEKLNEHRKALTNLFSRLFYSKLKDDTPIMTGDICIISEDLYGIIVTPECDIRVIKDDEDLEFELLTFKKNEMNSLLQLRNFDRASQNIDDFTGSKRKEERREKLRKVFNNEEPRIHIIPAMPIFNENGKESCVIDFRHSIKRIKSSDVKLFERPIKLNSPFIQQLRQRYLSYTGRVGTPALPNQVRDWNLSLLQTTGKGDEDEKGTALSNEKKKEE